MVGKISSLFNSRRFWVSIAGVVFVLLSDGLGVGITQDQVSYIVLLGGAWVVGDSLRAS